MRVAVCFVGQFLRGTNADSGVVRLRHRFAPGFGAHANYDAYIATSTQVKKASNLIVKSCQKDRECDHSVSSLRVCTKLGASFQ